MITMTYSLAMAIGQDAANAAMRKRVGKNPRLKMRWNRAEYNLAAEMFNIHWPAPVLAAAEVEA